MASPVARYFKNILIGIDQLICTLIAGAPDESLSSYAWRMDVQGKPWGRFWRPLIDRLFSCLGVENHCYRAWRAEVLRRQMPPELR